MNYRLLPTILMIMLTNIVYSQITYVSADNSNGDWYATSTWTRLPVSETWAPATPGNPTNSNANAITVNGYVRVESGGLTINNANPVVTVNDTLYIVGDVTLGSGASLSVASNGILIVTGNLTLQGSFNIANGGNIVVKGNLNVTNGSIQNNEDFYVFGTTSVSGGGTVNGCDGYGNPSGCDPASTGGIGDESDLDSNNPDLSDFVTNEGILPVELLFFTGSYENDKIVLTWVTASQINFDYFSIEHSTNGTNWSEITQVRGAGTTNEMISYTFQHTLGIYGVNYYRLKSVDFDGTFEYSPIAAVETEVIKNVSVYPNPSKDSEQVSFELNFVPDDGDMVVIVDLLGYEVLRTYVTSDTRGAVLPLLKQGTYIMKYTGNAFTSTCRIMIR